MVKAIPTVWVAVNWINEVAIAPQTNIGIRNNDMPLARMVAIVTKRLIAPAIDEKPLIQKPRGRARRQHAV